MAAEKAHNSDESKPDMTTLEVLHERVTELVGHYKSLSKSYQVLNESHHELELGLNTIETEWKTNKAWFKFIFGTSLIGTLIGIVSLLKTLGII